MTAKREETEGHLSKQRININDAKEEDVCAFGGGGERETEKEMMGRKWPKSQALSSLSQQGGMTNGH